MKLETPDGTYGQYATNGSGAFNYVEPAPNPALASMDTTGNDGLIEFSHTVFDTGGNGIEQHTFELNRSDTDGIDIDATDSYVRRSVFNYYDAADRLTTTADFGSGDGDSSPATWSYSARPARPSEPTWTTDMVYNGYVLLTAYGYDAGSGRLDAVTTGTSRDGTNNDTKKTVAKNFYDDLSRRIAVVENWVNATVDGTNAGGGTNNEDDRFTRFEYNGLGQQTSITAVNVASSTVYQLTRYYYEDPYNASLLTHTVYPDSSSTPSSGTDLVKLDYNLDGSLKKKTGQRGTVIDYTYTSGRQLELEKVTTLGGNTDGHVRSIKREYDTLQRLEKVTSYASSDGTGTVRNQIKYTYDTTHGKLTKTEQSHEGAVSSSPAVEYAYDDGVDGSNVYGNILRPKNFTYPNGRKIHLNYDLATTPSAELNRIFMYEADNSGSPGTDLTLYSYNGTSRLALTLLLVPTISASSVNIDGAGSYVYNGFDRFGREVIKEWYQYTAGQWRDRFEYTLDFAGNRLERNSRVDLINGSYTDNRDQLYAYDRLQRLATMDEGALSGGAISAPTNEQDWTLDQLGNWAGFIVKASGTTTLNQTRYHNSVNEIDTNNDHTDGPGASITASVGTNWADPKYDAAGNMTTMPQPASLGKTDTLKYDAWNRLVEVYDDDQSQTVQTNEYDGLGRRIVRVDVKANPDVTYDYYYNEAWQILEERKDADTQPLNQYLWHPYYIDALAIRWYDANTDGSGVAEYYYLHDANYNVTAVTDNSGAVLERYSYTPYGQVSVLDADFAADSDGISDIGNTHFYTGRELDPETGLQLNRQRFYASHLGRWVTRDIHNFETLRGEVKSSVSEEFHEYIDGLNLYEYVHDGPTALLDPVGEQSLELITSAPPKPKVPKPKPPVVPAPFVCVCRKVGGDPDSNARECTPPAGGWTIGTISACYLGCVSCNKPKVCNAKLGCQDCMDACLDAHKAACKAKFPKLSELPARFTCYEAAKRLSRWQLKKMVVPPPGRYSLGKHIFL